MGHKEEQLRLAWSPKTRRDLEALVDDVTSVVLRMCNASAVAFDFGPVVSGMSLDIRVVDGADDAALSHARFILVEAAAQGEIMDEWLDADADPVVVRFPLDVDDYVLGSLAVAIPADQWAGEASVTRCRDVARMVALNASQTSVVAKLELDLAEINQRLQTMAKNAERDPLTEVKNKTAFERHAKARMMNPEKPTALIAFDLDGFKSVNDIYGHQFGDVYLKTVADTLRKSFPENSLIGRTGGDEFCIVTDLPASGRSYLNNLLARVRASLQRNVAYLGKPDLGRVSIGISLYPRQSTKFDELFGFADTALYASKRAGRNTTTVFHASLNLFGPSNVRQTAQSPGEFIEHIVPHMQPIVDLETGLCSGFEVLARWKTPEGQFYEPLHFEWMFRDYRMAKRLTRHIIENALEAFCAGTLDPGADMPDIWINVTAFDLLDPEFVFDLQSMLLAYDVGWDSIVIEVSEQIALGQNGGQLYRSLEEIRRRGGRVALDDFGTGHAGLQHVQDWPVDIVKIDKFFTGPVAHGENSEVVVEALLRIAKRLGRTVVAEGVETPMQLTALQKLGCAFGQGFLFGAAEPLPPPLHGPEARLRQFDLQEMTREVSKTG
ncbi:EAL domain-containing protein [Gymnodinialimonas sp. 2305UL16-5]|uniref:putative bifunctional diguanylate cyclase/phosphodiesterase n=1 Tax=Gymnodinialimonas mytili TaxID=3126503 RepID=UPI0030AF8333